MAYLGVDCGTQGTKALLVDARGRVLGRGYARHSLMERSSGAREQEPAWWIEALRLSVREALAAAPAETRVEGIGVSGQQHGLVVLDDAGQVIRPAKLWNDTETSACNEEMLRRHGGAAAFQAKFGIAPLTGYTVSKLLWLAEHEPQNFARIRHILLPHEYLNWWLTGEFRAEAGDASGTGYFDPRTRTWAVEVLDSIDGGSGMLRAALPALIANDECVGTLTDSAALALGLPAGCPVAAGGGDNMMGAIGTGNVREGVLTLSLGTSSTVYTYRDAAPTGAEDGVAPFCSSSGGWLPLVCTMNCTSVVTGTLQLLGKSVQQLDQALEQTEPGAGGLVMLPFLNGERTPDLPQALGSLHGISATNYSAENLVRAAVEGVTFGTVAGLELILRGAPAGVIHAIGGGARSKAWRQMLADITGATVLVPAEEEAGCLGAAIQARVACARRRGEASDFATAAAEMVRMDESRRCEPRTEYFDRYNQARAAYAAQLKHAYPAVALT